MLQEVFSEYRGSGVSGVVVCSAAPSQATVLMTVASGSQFTWDGTYGPVSTTGVVPDNLALASNGATAFANSTLAGSIAGLNDGKYGNSYSWIASSSQTIALGGTWGSVDTGFAGISFPNSVSISSFALSRTNLSSESYNTRVGGTFYVQVTTASAPNASTSDSSWTTIGSYTNNGSTDADEGDVDGARRHQFDLNSPVTATGLRILVPWAADLGGAKANTIDEIEVYGTPEPSTIVLLATGLIGLLAYAWRKRR